MSFSSPSPKRGIKAGNSVHLGLLEMKEPSTRKKNKHVTLRSEGEEDGEQKTSRRARSRSQQNTLRASARSVRKGLSAESQRAQRLLLRTDPTAWGLLELQEAGRRHPLPLPLLVNLVLATGSPTWTYSMRQLWKLFDVIDCNGDQELSLDEIKRTLEGEQKVRDFVRSIGNATLTDLLSPPWTTTEKAFETIDAAGNGRLSRGEWLSFITEARAIRLKHYKVKLLLTRTCFAGHGLEDNWHNPRTKKPAQPYRGWLVRRGWIPLGWWEDYKFYLFNNTKYAAACFADPDHPFPKAERVLDLVCVLGWSLFLSTYVSAERWAFENPHKDHSHLKSNVVDRGLPFVFEYVFFGREKSSVGLSPLEGLLVSLVCVSLPVVLLGEFNYQMLACPCLEIDLTTLSLRKRTAFGLCRSGLRLYSQAQIRILALACSVLWCLGLYALTFPGVTEYIVSSWVPSLVGAVLLECCQKAVFEFNPSPRASLALRCFVYYPTCLGAGGAFVPGRWLDERAKVISAIHEAAATRGKAWTEVRMPASGSSPDSGSSNSRSTSTSSKSGRSANSSDSSSARSLSSETFATEGSRNNNNGEGEGSISSQPPPPPPPAAAAAATDSFPSRRTALRLAQVSSQLPRSKKSLGRGAGSGGGGGISTRSMASRRGDTENTAAATEGVGAVAVADSSLALELALLDLLTVHASEEKEVVTTRDGRLGHSIERAASATASTFSSSDGSSSSSGGRGGCRDGNKGSSSTNSGMVDGGSSHGSSHGSSSSSSPPSSSPNSSSSLLPTAPLLEHLEKVGLKGLALKLAVGGVGTWPDLMEVAARSQSSSRRQRQASAATARSSDGGSSGGSGKGRIGRGDGSGDGSGKGAVGESGEMKNARGGNPLLLNDKSNTAVDCGNGGSGGGGNGGGERVAHSSPHESSLPPAPPSDNNDPFDLCGFTSAVNAMVAQGSRWASTTSSFLPSPSSSQTESSSKANPASSAAVSNESNVETAGDAVQKADVGRAQANMGDGGGDIERGVFSQQKSAARASYGKKEDLSALNNNGEGGSEAEAMRSLFATARALLPFWDLLDGEENATVKELAQQQNQWGHEEEDYQF